MHDRVALANIGKELIAKAFAFAGAFDKAGDIDEFDRCRFDRGVVIQFAERC